MGIKLGQLQEAALTLEGSQFGSSEGLVRERDCSSLLDTVSLDNLKNLFIVSCSGQGEVGSAHRPR